MVTVIDDDIETAMFFYEALCQNVGRISVFSFLYPVKAFEHFTENNENYALLISDLRMPSLNGLEMLKKIITSNPKVRTILMSAYNFEEEPTLEKPVIMNRLYERVRDEYHK